MIINLTVELIKNTWCKYLSYKMSQYFLKSFENSDGNVKVKSDLSIMMVQKDQNLLVLNEK